MPENQKDLQELIELLEQAAQEMIAYGPKTTLTNYDTCENLGFYLNEVITKLEQKKEIDVFELWGIFAPTSVWDDSFGSEEIANKIFEKIKKIYGDKLRY
jgi:hypothetical protein